MSNPYTLASSTFTVISSPTASWETSGAAVNEGPEPLYHNGRTFLTSILRLRGDVWLLEGFDRRRGLLAVTSRPVP